MGQRAAPADSLLVQPYEGSIRSKALLWCLSVLFCFALCSGFEKKNGDLRLAYSTVYGVPQDQTRQMNY